MGLDNAGRARAANSDRAGLYESAAAVFCGANSVIFDFDSLLVASREFHQAFLKRCLELVDVSPSTEFLNAYRSAAGRSYRTLVETIWRHEVSTRSLATVEDFWDLVVARCHDVQFLSSVQACVQPVDEADLILSASPKKGIILSGSPRGIVEHLIERSGLGSQLARYPLFSVFESPDGKLKAGSMHPSIGQHLAGAVVALDDSLASARATLAGLGLRHAIVKAFEPPDRHEAEHHFDGNRIFEITSWLKLCKLGEGSGHEQRAVAAPLNKPIALQKQREKQKKQLAENCAGILSRMRGLPGELLLGGGVSVALSCREFREPSCDFDFNVFLPGLPEIPGALLAWDDVQVVSHSLSQAVNQSAKIVLSMQEGLRIDMIFVRRIRMGSWIVESSVDEYLRSIASQVYCASEPILLVPPEMVVFEKLLAGRGPEVGKHDLFDVISQLEVQAPASEAFRHMIQSQRVVTSEAYLVAGAEIRSKRAAIISVLVSRLREVELLCHGLHRDSHLYANYLHRIDRELVMNRCNELALFLESLRDNSVFMQGKPENIDGSRSLRTVNDSGV